MTPATYHIDLYQGSTFDRELTYKDGTGSVVDLSSHTARFEIRKPYDAGIILALTETDGLQLSSTEPNIVLTITDEQTAAMDFSTATHTLTIMDASGRRYPLLRGKVTFHREGTA